MDLIEVNDTFNREYLQLDISSKSFYFIVIGKRCEYLLVNVLDKLLIETWGADCFDNIGSSFRYLKALISIATTGIGNGERHKRCGKPKSLSAPVSYQSPVEAPQRHIHVDLKSAHTFPCTDTN